MATNPDLTYVEFADGQGFETDPADTSIAIGVAKGSELTAQINEALATISDEERLQIMEDVLARPAQRGIAPNDARAASGAGTARRGFPAVQSDEKARKPRKLYSHPRELT